MRHHRLGRATAGFTLVELLIALSMISLITLLLFSGLRLGANTWERVDASVERLAERRAAHAFLVRTLNQMRPETLMLDAEPHAIFAGDAERLEFVAPLSRHLGLPGLYLLRLSLEPSDQGTALVLTHWLLHPEVLAGAPDSPPWTPLAEEEGVETADALGTLDENQSAGAFGRTPLLDNAEGFAIRYFGAREGDTEPGWHEDWLAQPVPPQLIRVRLDNSGWPDLEVAPVAPRQP
ncbi:MAG: prepilin-type N-terminal cleavage/methylation domain-containing protein [Chromatiaceae bacterium]|nr:prepilin-type N-terminal cleavage/methylation domain-containing protein [Chromatiaceae bacterium]